MNAHPAVETSLADAEEIRSATARIDWLNSESFRLRHLDMIKADTYAREALTLSEKISYQTGIGYAALNTGFQEMSAAKYREAFQSFNRAMSVFKKQNDQRGIAHAHYNLGLVYLRMGDFQTAMEVQQESISIRRQLADEDGIASCKAQIGYLNGQFGLDDTALADYNECLNIWRKINNRAGIANVLLAIGITKLKLNQLEEARQHLIESRDIRIELNEINGVHVSVNYLSAVYLRQNNKEEALQILKDALAEALAQKQPYTIGICRLRLGLAKVYTAMEEFPHALEQLDAALASAKESGQQYQLHDIYLELSTMYKAMGCFDKALENFEKFHEHKESIINLNAATRLKNLEMINKIESREKEIEIERLRNVELRDRNRTIREERKKSERLLLNILPAQTAKELKKHGIARPREYPLVSVLFCDFVSFTHTSEQLSPEQLVKKLDTYFRGFDEITIQHGIEKIKTIGDAYMAAGGIPIADQNNPVQTVRAGLDILTFVQEKNDPLFRIRIGIHTGPVVAGIVGIRKFAYDIWGDTVNTASRMESSGEAGQLNISGTTYDLVKDHFVCRHRGKIEAKKKGMMDMYFVEGIRY